MQRRTFLGTAISALQLRAAAGFELLEVGVADLSKGLASGRWTSRRLVQLYRQRIADLHKLGAVIEINPDADAIAAKLDAERKQGRVRGVLHGIPILIKDNIDTADRMSTTAGSLALEGWHPPQDAPIAASLRAAGAVILGKTNLSEWANYRSTHSISGWSGRGGQAHNPYILTRNPSGSSSGSGVAVSANLCAAAIGTETDGSVVSPASINGIVGLKPTLGLLNGEGIIPIAHSQDTAGPMGRTVEDVALLLTALTGTDFTKSLDANGLKGARLGIARKFFEKNAPIDAFLSHCVDQLKRCGAEVMDPADLPSHNKWLEAEDTVLSYEFKTYINEYLARLPQTIGVHTFADLIRFNQSHRDREMPFFDQEIFEQAEARGPLSERKYKDARAECLKLTREEGIDQVLKHHKLDAIVTLTSGPAWLIDTVNGDTDTGGCSSPPAVAGYPHLTVPAGFFRDLPMGLSFIGTAGRDAALLKLGYAWERTAQARRKPLFRSV